MSIYRVRTLWTGPSSPAVSTLFFDVAAGFTPQQLADAVEDFWVAASAGISSAFGWDIEDEVRQYNEVTGALQSAISVTGASGVGADANARIDLLQGLINWATGQVVNNRIVYGRTFIPGVTEQVNDTNGTPTAGYLSVLNSAIAALAVGVPDAQVIWHRPVDGAGGEALEVIAGAPKDQWSYLRTRRA